MATGSLSISFHALAQECFQVYVQSVSSLCAGTC